MREYYAQFLDDDDLYPKAHSEADALDDECGGEEQDDDLDLMDALGLSDYDFM